MLSIAFRGTLLVALWTIGILVQVVDSHAANEAPFRAPLLIPLRTFLSADAYVLDPIYQVRHVEFVDTNKLVVTAAYKGQRSKKNQDLLINLSGLQRDLGNKQSVNYGVALYEGWDNPLDVEEFEENEFWDKQKLDPKKVNVRSYKGTYFSSVPGNESYRWEWVPVVPKYVAPHIRPVSRVFFDASNQTIVVANETSRNVFKHAVEAGDLLKDRGLGFQAQDQGGSSEIDVVALEVSNGFWDVLKLDKNPPTQRPRLRRLFGPEVTSPNKGFIPGTMSLSWRKRPWLAYVGPEMDGGLWSISVWDIDKDSVLRSPLAKIGTGRVAYSQHRGFDHRVAWTGPNSIIFLENDELTVSHVQIKADGKTTRLGSYQFGRGTTLVTRASFLGLSWVQDFELFRLEAIAARSINLGQDVRVALVAIVRYEQDGVVRQTALPLIIDLPWNLKDPQ